MKNRGINEKSWWKGSIEYDCGVAKQGSSECKTYHGDPEDGGDNGGELRYLEKQNSTVCPNGKFMKSWDLKREKNSDKIRMEMECCSVSVPAPAPAPAPTQTCGGTAGARATCTFPFEYRQDVYTSCTKRDHDRPWCYTGKGKWGNCDCEQ